MAASVGFPFTNAQLKELERQAMIYKYMVASVPVPPDLLLPFTRNFSASTLSHSQCNLLSFSSSITIIHFVTSGIFWFFLILSPQPNIIHQNFVFWVLLYAFIIIAWLVSK